MAGRPEFNPNENFIVIKRFLCAGEPQEPGTPFDTSLCLPKTLKQLYDQRRICFASEYRDPSRIDSGRPGASAVTIPENWDELPWPARRKLASALSTEPILNGKDAERAITAELERRDQLP